MERQIDAVGGSQSTITSWLTTASKNIVTTTNNIVSKKRQIDTADLSTTSDASRKRQIDAVDLPMSTIVAKPTTSDVSVFVLWLAWTCLSLTVNAMKNAVLDYIFPSQEIMEVIMSRASFEFGNDLLDTMQSRTAPTISYFKSLPLYLRKFWAVYLVVLEKEGQRPRIYIGTGTSVRSGVKSRLDLYDKVSLEGQYGKSVAAIPRYVEMLIREGYTISHKGLLAWTSIPPFNEQYALRGFFLILECAFSLYFWAMKSRTKDYSMPALCPWPRDSLTYDGCCTHCSIKEGLIGTAAILTPEELATLEADRLKAKREWQSRYGREYVAALGPGVKAARSTANYRKVVEEQRYKCTVCDLAFDSNARLLIHQTRPVHIRKAAGIPTKARRKKFWCEICQIDADSAKRLANHLKTPRHARKLRELASSSKLN